MRDFLKNTVAFLTRHLAFIIHFALAFLFAGLVAQSMQGNRILVFNDGPSLMSLTEVRRFSFIYPEYFGMNAGIQTAMNLTNLLVFGFLYTLKDNTAFATTIFTFFILLILWQVSYLGFRKLIKFFSNQTEELFWPAFLANCAFQFGHFAYQNMNAGITFSVSYLAYSFLPWIFYALLNWPNTKSSHRKAYTIAIGLMGGSFLLHVPYMWPVFIALCVFFFVSGRISQLLPLWKHIIVSFLIALQVSAYFLYAFIFESVVNSSNFVTSNLGNGVANLYRGELWYQFLQYSSWMTYTRWTDRAVLTYAQYTQSHGVIIVTVAFLLAILLFLPKVKKITPDIKGLLAVWLVSLYFAKGFQKPFGSLFSFLIENFSIFGAIRTPDNKFGATAAFATAALLGIALLYARKSKYKKILFIITVCYLISASLPMLTGEILFGRPYSKVYGGYLADLTEYQPIISHLQSAPKDVAILKVPGDVASYDQAEIRYVGRDVIRGYIPQTIEYAQRKDPKRNIYEFNNISPVTQYILYYKNTRTLLESWQEEELKKENTLVISTPTVDLYQTPSTRRILESDVSAAITMHAASKFQVHFSDPTAAKLTLWQNYNSRYKLIPLSASFLHYPKWLQDIAFPLYALTHQGISGAPVAEKDYTGVVWDVGVTDTQDYMVYFMPQAYFELFIVFSLLSMLLYSAVCVIYLAKGDYENR